MRPCLGIHSPSETLLLNATAPQMFDDKGNGILSTVLLDWIEWEGPLVSEEEKSRPVGLVPPNDATPEVFAKHLQLFAERAWRRPVKLEDVTRSPGPPSLGSSGTRIRFETDLIIEGIRPGRTVRVRPGNWPQVQVPWEEYLDDGSSSTEERFPSPAIFPKY